MSRFVRPSKYRHCFGQNVKKEQCYDNIKVSANAWDTNLVAVNPKYIAVNYQSSGGGAFLVNLLSKTGKVPDIFPLCRAHTAPVLDTAWNPFNDDIIASAGEDGKVAITQISEEILLQGWDPEVESQDIEPVTRLPGHGRKVGHVVWHPTAGNVLASASRDIRFWDVTSQSELARLEEHGDMVQSLSFNHTGSLLATTCKDKKLRLFDVRSGPAPVTVADSHMGIKGSRVCWMGSLDRIVTTGFSKMSDRQVFLWNSGDLKGKRVKELTVDTSSGTLMPFWSDNNILFLAGKGDGNIRYYEYENDDLFYLTEYSSSDPQRGMAFLPRRALDTDQCEIAKAFKVTSNLVEPISFIVPRKADSYQADIYPPAPSSKPALTADEFFGGKTSGPILLDLENKTVTSAAPVQSTAPQRQASTPAAPPALAPAAAPAPAPAPAPTTTSKPPSRAPTLDSTPVAPPPAFSSAAETVKPPSYADHDDAIPSSAALPTAAEEKKTLSSSAAFASTNGNGSAGTSGSGSSSSASGEVAQLRKENEQLTGEVDDQRRKIRELELETEKLKSRLGQIMGSLQGLSL